MPKYIYIVKEKHFSTYRAAKKYAKLLYFKVKIYKYELIRQEGNSVEHKL